MKQLISIGFQKAPDSPRDMDATWEDCIRGSSTGSFKWTIDEGRCRKVTTQLPVDCLRSAPFRASMFVLRSERLARRCRRLRRAQMMKILGNPLFFGRDNTDLDSVLRYRTNALQQKIDTLPEALLAEKPDEEIAHEIALSEAIEPLAVNFDKAVPQVTETHVEVRDSYGFRRGPFQVPGLRATKTIPFQGDRQLWEFRPNNCTLNPLRGEIQGQTLIVGVEIPTQQADQAKAIIDQTIAAIPQYLAAQKVQIENHNDRIRENAIQFLRQRRGRLNQASELLKKLQS